MPRSMTPAKPLPTWERPKVSGPQFLAINESPQMAEARGALSASLRSMGFPPALMAAMGTVFGLYTSAVLDAVIEVDEQDFEQALAEYFPSVAADMEAGMSPLESALKHHAEEREREQVAEAIHEAEPPGEPAGPPEKDAA